MYQVSGRVIHGQHYGRVLGFPTANIDRREYSRLRMKVRLGVWAGNVEIVSSIKYHVLRKYKAAIVIGPIDKIGLPKIEAHLVGFRGSLYGKKITITLHKYLRPFKKFKTESGLKKQISADIVKVKKYG